MDDRHARKFQKELNAGLVALVLLAVLVMAVALLAIAAGKHVLVEKAFTRNATEAAEVVAAADADRRRDLESLGVEVLALSADPTLSP